MHAVTKLIFRNIYSVEKLLFPIITFDDIFSTINCDNDMYTTIMTYTGKENPDHIGGIVCGIHQGLYISLVIIYYFSNRACRYV